jgi:hypothetical protein
MMSHFAFVANGIVVEVIPDTIEMDGFSIHIEQRYHSDFVSGLVACPDDVTAGYIYDGKAFAPPVTASLAAVKESLKSIIDVGAEAERLKYITPGAGQAMTYQQKADEAARYLAASAPKASDYPLLSAEAGITAADIAGVAQVVSAAFAQWQAIGGAIEAVRLGAKKSIDDASTIDAANAAARVTWPTPAS